MTSHLRTGEDSPRIPIRMFLSNQSGYYLDISMYKEVTDEKTGQVVLSYVFAYINELDQVPITGAFAGHVPCTGS